MEGEAVQGSVRFPGGGYKAVVALLRTSLWQCAPIDISSVPSASIATLVLGMSCSLDFVESDSALVLREDSELGGPTIVRK